MEELGLDAKVEKVEDLIEIVKLGVLSAPSLMVNGKLVISGQAASKSAVMKYLKRELS